jgi:nicotinate dehydrogenase subunit B
MNESESLNLDFTDFKFDPSLSRRELLKTLAGGIVIFFCCGDSSVLAAQRRGGRPLPDDFNAFLRIGENGRVTCYTGKIEQGQGVITSLAQMLADELDVALESVDMVMGDTSLCPWDMGTFGSMTTRFFGPPLRAAGAEARSVLLELAAEQLKVPQDRLVADNGVIYDKQQKDTRITYGELAKGKTIARRPKEKPALKSPSEFNVMNKSFHRRDSVEKVTGKAQYAGDIRLPGMLYASLLRPPAHGAKLKKVDTSAAEKLEGIKVVHEGDLVADLHNDPGLVEDPGGIRALPVQARRSDHLRSPAQERRRDEVRRRGRQP